MVFCTEQIGAERKHIERERDGASSTESAPDENRISALVVVVIVVVNPESQMVLRCCERSGWKAGEDDD